jgi:hypothetical protein
LSEGRRGPEGRRILRRLVVLACPPDPGLPDLTDRVVAEFDLHVAQLPGFARRTMGPALRLFDQAARLRNGGRRFVRLDPARADAHLARVLYGRTSPVATVIRLVKSLVVMAYYELPEVKEQLGYDPAPYVADVTARRLARYGAEIRAAEADP